MRCELVEDRLSGYIERTLSHEEMVEVAEHLKECPRCLSLMEEIQSIVVTCQAFPSYDVDTALLDRIVLRTLGRPRTRTLRERLRAYFLQPILTPRFAAGVGLTLLSVALLASFITPRMNRLASAFSYRELLLQMDRGVQQIYSEGLKLYDAKNEWQAQFVFLKNSVLHRLGFMIDQIDVPIEGNKKPAEQKQPEKAPGQKGSIVWLLSA
jgi:hypothetical protein